MVIDEGGGGNFDCEIFLNNKRGVEITEAKLKNSLTIFVGKSLELIAINAVVVTEVENSQKLI